MTETKLLQKLELSKDLINSIIDKAIKDLFETTTIPEDCGLNYKIEKVEENRVRIKFSWTRNFDNYDSSVNSWDEVYDDFSSVYDFSKDKEALLDEIYEELSNKVIVNF